MARTDSGSNRDSGVGGAGTPGSGRDSSSSSGGRSGGSTSTSSSGGRSSGASSSASSSSGGRSSGASSPASAGRSSGGINAGGGSDNSRSTGAASSGGNSRDGAAAGASAGRSSAGASSTSAGRSSAGTGRSSGGGTIGAGLTGSGLAERGGRVTGGGFDSGRFGDAPMAEKGGRVGASPQAEKGGRVTSPEAGRFSGGSSVGRQSSKGGSFSNGGRNSDRAGARASAAPARSASVGTGLGVGLTAPSRSARAAETASMDALSRTRQPTAGSPRRAEDASMSALSGARSRAGSPNYGLGQAAAARRAEDQSMAKHSAWQSSLGTIRDAEAQKAPNPATGRADPYNGVVGGRGTPTHANLTDMTIAEVQDYQSGMVARGHSSTAVGAYQTLRETLAEAVKRTGLSPDTKFTRATQDFIAQDLVANRARQATREGIIDPTRFGDRLASEWAALPASSGQSAYQGVNGNRATVGRDATMAAATALTSTGAVGPGAAKEGRFGQTYLADATPPSPRSDRLPGLAGIAQGPARARSPSPTSGTIGNIATFDRSNLSAGVRDIADAIGVAVPGAGVNSAYRSPEHNARVGGAKASQHVQGNAIDVNMRGWTDDQRRAALDAAIASGARGIGIYNGGTTLHADARPGSKAMWGGNPAGQYAAMSFAQAPDWARASLESWKNTDANPAAPVPSNSELMAQAAPAAAPAASKTATRTASADRFQSTYLGSVPSSPAQAAKPERTVGDRLVAGAIDVGVGLLPGIGTAAGLYSMAAPMIGLPTVGEMALSLRDRNKTGTNRAIAGKNEGGAGREIDERLRIARAEPTAMPQVAEPEAPGSFAEKYLGWSGDGVARPTPMEKWGPQASYAL